jgi:hypothetical protein
VEGVGAHAEAGQLGIDLRAARFACSYSSSTSTPAPSPSTKPSRSLSQGRDAAGGIVVARGQRTRRREAADAQRRDRALGAAGDHHVGIAVLDQPRRLADAVQPGGAGGHDGEVRAR